LAFVSVLLASVVSAGCAATYSSQIDSIMSIDTLNQASAGSAPQQTVVNGWTARDLLELSARQSAEMTYIMYGLLAVGIVLVLLLVIMARRLSRLEAALSQPPSLWSPRGEGQPADTWSASNEVQDNS
jgi:hypothetical protein